MGQSLRDIARENAEKIVSQEVRTTSSTGGQKGVKPRRFSLLPWRALGEVAEHYAKGAEKYDDHNWRKGYEWSKSYDSLQRHLADWVEGEDLDEDGYSNLAAAAFHVLTLMTYAHEHPDFDDRYKRPEGGSIGTSHDL